MFKKIIGVLLVAIVISVCLMSLNEKQFDSIVWKTEPSMRYKMSKDIIENERFIGKTKQDVISLLGNPDVSNLEGKDHLIYPLGKAPSFFESKNEKLVLIFQNSIVTKVIHSKD